MATPSSPKTREELEAELEQAMKDKDPAKIEAASQAYTAKVSQEEGRDPNKDRNLGTRISDLGKKLGEKLMPPSVKGVDMTPLSKVSESLGAITPVNTQLLDAQLGKQAPTTSAVMANRQDIQNVTAQKVDPTLITRQDQDIRNQQLALASALQAQAAGTGAPSAAQLQLNQGLEQAIAAQAAQAAAARGGNPVLAQRQAMQNVSNLQAQTSADAALLRAKESEVARQQLGSVLQGARGQDIDVNTAQAQLDQQTKIVNAETNLKQQLANQGVDLDVVKANAAAGNQVAIENLKAELVKQGLDAEAIKTYLMTQLGITQQQADIAKTGVTTQADINKTQATNKASGIGGLISSVGSALASIFSSDINLKKNIKKDDSDLKDFLDKLTNYKYEYKDPDYLPGEQTSIMAQDLEKSQIGKQAIIETPEGKMVNYSRLLPAMLSANVDANERITNLEQALKAKNKKGK
jgi:hypothetical protein